MKHSIREMRAEALELIEIKFQFMIGYVLDKDMIMAEYTFDTLVGALDMAHYLDCISYAERMYIINAALEALYE